MSLIYKILPCRCVSCKSICFDGSLCVDCQNKLDRFGQIEVYPEKRWQKAFSVFKYHGPVVDLIHRFKFENGLGLGKYFAGEMIKILLNDDSYDYIIPVPLHKTKLHARGYNQSLILSEFVGKHIKVQVKNDVLICNKNISLLGLNKAERWNAVKNVYSGRKTEKLFKKKVLLIDDVMTTGSTLNACTRAIQKLGSQSVNVVVIAKT